MDNLRLLEVACLSLKRVVLATDYVRLVLSGLQEKVDGRTVWRHTGRTLAEVWKSCAVLASRVASRWSLPGLEPGMVAAVFAEGEGCAWRG